MLLSSSPTPHPFRHAPCQNPFSFPFLLCLLLLHLLFSPHTTAAPAPVLPRTRPRSTPLHPVSVPSSSSSSPPRTVRSRSSTAHTHTHTDSDSDTDDCGLPPSDVTPLSHTNELRRRSRAVPGQWCDDDHSDFDLWLKLASLARLQPLLLAVELAGNRTTLFVPRDLAVMQTAADLRSVLSPTKTSTYHQQLPSEEDAFHIVRRFVNRFRHPRRVLADILLTHVTRADLPLCRLQYAVSWPTLSGRDVYRYGLRLLPTATTAAATTTTSTTTTTSGQSDVDFGNSAVPPALLFFSDTLPQIRTRQGVVQHIDRMIIPDLSAHPLSSDPPAPDDRAPDDRAPDDHNNNTKCAQYAYDVDAKRAAAYGAVRDLVLVADGCRVMSLFDAARAGQDVDVSHRHFRRLSIEAITARDDAEEETVKFRVDGQLVYTDRTAPFYIAGNSANGTPRKWHPPRYGKWVKITATTGEDYDSVIVRFV